MSKLLRKNYVSQRPSHRRIAPLADTIPSRGIPKRVTVVARTITTMSHGRKGVSR